jgi:hypothetical protein
MADREADAGSGALFKNDRKEKPTHPDYRGDATINGTKYWVSAWIKEGKKGKYMSLSFRPANEEDAKPAPNPKAKAKADDGDLPF